MVCWPDTRARSAAHAVNINKPGCVLCSVAWGIVNFRSDLDGDIYHDNDGSHSTPLLLLRLVERMEWKGYSNIHSLSPSFYTLPCEVYFQEAISIYKADLNLSIDLCFQGSLRKLFAEEGQRILSKCFSAEICAILRL